MSAGTEAVFATGCAMIGGGVGSAITMALWGRLHRTNTSAPTAAPSVVDHDLDRQSWDASEAWARRRGHPEAAGLAYGYIRDTAEYLMRRRRTR